MLYDSFLEADSLRYEQKFLISELDRYQVESIIRRHPAMFSEIFHERSINSIYCDSWDMDSYLDTKYGISQRAKVRIRWYGQLFGTIDNPVLELKIKNNQLRGKVLFPLKPLVFDCGFSSGSLRELFNAADIPEILREDLALMRPTLLTRYSRRYFQSADRQYRLTVDWDIEYYALDNSLNTFRMKKRDRVSTVLELKYAADVDESRPNLITNAFPFRLSRNSKYVVGIDSLFVTTQVLNPCEGL